LANKRVTAIPNDFCISFQADTTFTEVAGEVDEDYQTDFEKSLIEDSNTSFDLKHTKDSKYEFPTMLEGDGIEDMTINL